MFTLLTVSQPLAGLFVFIAVVVLAVLMTDTLQGKPPPRLAWTMVATLLLLAVIALLAPQQLPVSLYKISLVSMAGLVGYWLDREIFPYARPDSFIDSEDDDPEPTPDEANDIGAFVIRVRDTSLPLLFAAAMLRRAVLIGCAMLAIGLGA